jgi:predicted AAA+ superfamily ATPase
MIKRRVEAALDAWKAASDRKPLILRGARQVGKTYSINAFGSSFRSYIRLDLERPADRALFTRAGSGRALWETILLAKGLSPDPSETLLFIDEIQGSPAAVAALRLLYEDLPELAVVAAGSLFEVFAHREGLAAPVGRVRNLYLSPVDFGEYLAAANLPLARLLDDLAIGAPLPPERHALLTEAFGRFALVGGMPEAVAHFIERGSLAELGPIYDAIFQGYVEDAEKYASRAKAKYLSQAVDRAPFHAGERITYEKFGGGDFRSREMKEALATLEQALIIHLAVPTPSLRPPFRESGRRAPKLFFVDAGLVRFRLGLRGLGMGEGGGPLDDHYRGRIAEQIAAQEILAASFERPRLHFWARETGQAEIDFLLDVEGLAVPLEIKSGKPGRMRSLAVFMDEADHPYAVRISGDPIRVDEARTPGGKTFKLLSLPFYCLPRLREMAAEFVKKG